MALEMGRATRWAITALVAALASTSLLGCISHEQVQQHMENVQRTLSTWGVSACDTMVHHTVDKLEDAAMSALEDPNFGACHNLINVDGCLNEGSKEIHLRAEERLAYWKNQCTGFVTNVTQNIFDYQKIKAAVDTFQNDIGPKMKEEVQAFLDLGMEHIKEVYKNAPKAKQTSSFKIAGLQVNATKAVQGMNHTFNDMKKGFQGFESKVTGWFDKMTDGDKPESDAPIFPRAPMDAVRQYESNIKVPAGSSPWPLIACCSAFAFVGFGVSVAFARRRSSASGDSAEESVTDMEAAAAEEIE